VTHKPVCSECVSRKLVDKTALPDFVLQLVPTNTLNYNGLLILCEKGKEPEND